MKTWKKVLISISIVAIITIIIGAIWYNKTYISKSEVKRIVLNDMNLSEKDVHFEAVDLEFDEGYYEVEFYHNNREFEYKINCKTGTIIYTDYQKEKNNKPVNNRPDSINNVNLNNIGTPNNANENNTGDSYSNDLEVTEDTARRIAMEHAGVPLEASNVFFKKTEKDYEHGTLVYEIEFIYDNYEYEYKIAVEDGTIIKHSKERD